MKKTIFLFFAAILCAMTANAYDQSAVDLYFDNSEAKWSSCYVYIGHSTWTSCYPLTRVSGTQYLWKLAKADFNGGQNWGGASGWVLCNEKWWDNQGESIDKYTWHGEKNVTKKRTSAWSASYIYKTNGTVSVTSDGNTINAYNTTTVSNKNYTVTINTVEGGTLTVKDYDDNAVATEASKIHLTVLKFSATPASGYVLEGVQINDGSTTTTISASEINTKTHTLTSNVTITPVWKATTSTVTVTATATNGTVTGGGVVEEGTSVTLTATPADGYKFVNWTVGGAEVSTANPYTFTAEEDVTVVANFEELPKTTVYFVNTPGWTDVKAYAYSPANASWPGVAATKEAEKIGDFDVYSYTATEGKYANVIFNGSGGQTADLTWSEGVDKYYIHDYNGNTGWYTKAEAEAILVVPVEYDYVYFINTDNWAKVNIYTWTPEVAGWPGAAMTKEAEQIAGKDVYSYKVVKGSTFGGMIFNNGDGTQTGDLVWQAGKYYMYSTNKWYDTKEDAEGALAGPATVVLHGNFVKADWGDTDAFELSADEKTATLTVLIKAGNYEFGVKLNNVWTSNGKAFTKTNNEHVIEAGSGNLTLNADITGNYVFTWTYETNTLTVTYPTEEVVVETNYYVTGTFNNNEPADANYKMTLEGEVYKATVGLKEGENKLKITDGSWDNTWGYGQLGANHQEVSDPSDFNNILITLDEDKNIVVIFDATAGKITFENLTEKAPAETKYYIAGTQNLTGFDWQVDGLEIAKASDVYKHTFSELPAGTFEFKVTQGDWNKESWGYYQLGAAYEEVSEGTDGEGNPNGNIKFITEEAKNITVIFDATAGKITFEGLTEKAPVEKHYYLIGTFNEWTLADANYELALVDGLYKKEVTLAKDAEFKVNQGDWDASWGKDNLGGKSYNELEGLEGGNLKMKEAKTFTIIFNPSENLITFDGLTENAPVAPKCYLMGNGDWENGVEMTVNPENADEFILLCHHISAPFKFKYGETWTDQVENYDFPGIAWADGNITLPEGDYDFYFKKNDMKVYIATCTPATPDYTRTVASGSYGTICLPNGSDKFEGAKFYEVTYKKGGYIYAEEVTTLVAGMPYIFQATSTEIKVYYNETPAAANAGSKNGVYGTFSDITDGEAGDADNKLEGNYLLVTGPKVQKCGEKCSLAANRAYFVVSEITDNETKPLPGRQRIALGCQEENQATGLDNITENGVVAPAMQGTYDILGRQLSEPAANGFYIINGKKVLVVK